MRFRIEVRRHVFFLNRVAFLNNLPMFLPTFTNFNILSNLKSRRILSILKKGINSSKSNQCFRRNILQLPIALYLKYTSITNTPHIIQDSISHAPCISCGTKINGSSYPNKSESNASRPIKKMTSQTTVVISTYLDQPLINNRL